MRSDLLVVLVILNIAIAAGLIVVYLYRDTWLLTPK